jgi:hypothetical protein
MAAAIEPIPDFPIITIPLAKDFIFEKILNPGITTYISEYTANTLADIKFNLYDHFGLSRNVILSSQDKQKMNTWILSIFKNIGIKSIFGMDHICINTKDNQRKDWTKLLNGNSYIEADTAKQNNNYEPHIYFLYNTSKPGFEGTSISKIHLMLKPDYILYCILKLTELHKRFPENRVTFKTDIFHKITPLNKTSIILNGGSVGSIIIYGSTNMDITKQIFRILFELFPNYDEMGDMNLTDLRTLTAGHVRINRMMSYAFTDRNKLLVHRDSDLQDFSKHTSLELPPWIIAMQRECSAGEKTNTESQLYIGKKICNEDGIPHNLLEICNSEPTEIEKEKNMTGNGALLRIKRNFCYMNPATIDPRELLAAAGGRASAAIVEKNVKTRKQIRRRKYTRRFITS